MLFSTGFGFWGLARTSPQFISGLTAAELRGTQMAIPIAKSNSAMVGDDLLVVAANRQVCPTHAEITFGNHSKCFPESCSRRLKPAKSHWW
jgi:hypothetical protein